MKVCSSQWELPVFRPKAPLGVGCLGRAQPGCWRAAPGKRNRQRSGGGAGEGLQQGGGLAEAAEGDGSAGQRVEGKEGEEQEELRGSLANLKSRML